MVRTREQAHADRAYRLVSEVSKAPPEERSQYGILAHNLPVLVRTSGLVGALEFVATRDRRANVTFLKHLEEHLRAAGLLKDKDLRSSAREASLTDYMRLTREILDVLLWHKRFAVSVLEIEQGSED